MAYELDARGRAEDHLNKIAAQRNAAAAAIAELTPEAMAAEEERQRKHAALMAGEVVEDGPVLAGALLPGGSLVEHGDDDLSTQLAAAVQPLLDEAGESAPDVYGIGRAVVQWVIAESESEDGEFELAVQMQIDEQPPGGLSIFLTTEMLDRWTRGVGLQGNRIEHAKLAAGLIEKAGDIALQGTGSALIFALEQLLKDRQGEAEVALNGDEMVNEGSPVSDDDDS